MRDIITSPLPADISSLRAALGDVTARGVQLMKNLLHASSWDLVSILGELCNFWVTFIGFYTEFYYRNIILPGKFVNYD